LLQASTKDCGDELCFDYIFMKGKVKVDPKGKVFLIGDKHVVPFIFLF
jgi:hypothetical protein